MSDNVDSYIWFGLTFVECPLEMCMNECELGFKKDEQGCNTCDCIGNMIIYMASWISRI